MQKNTECKKCATYYYLTDKKECDKIGIDYCQEGDPKKCTKCDNDCDIGTDEKSCIKRCIETESYCNQCVNNYESYDYGATCTVLDKDKEPQPEPKPQGNASLTNLNFAFIGLMLSFIL